MPMPNSCVSSNAIAIFADSFLEAPGHFGCLFRVSVCGYTIGKARFVPRAALRALQNHGVPHAATPIYRGGFRSPAACTENRKTYFRLNVGNPLRVAEGFSPLGRETREGEGLRGIEQGAGLLPHGLGIGAMGQNLNGATSGSPDTRLGRTEEGDRPGFDSGSEGGDPGVIAHESTGQRKEGGQHRQWEVARDRRLDEPHEGSHHLPAGLALDPDEASILPPEAQGQFLESLRGPVLTRAPARGMEGGEIGWGQPVLAEKVESCEAALLAEVDLGRRRRAENTEGRERTIEVVAPMDVRRRMRARVEERNAELRELFREEREVGPGQYQRESPEKR